ncbi:unnamed protein product [Ambrosiozyma monospora]|uniref:Unnamed protein product n=1 Tax=Ambrosiozyma monospora TaxID=43982 RepID=A0A9W7DJZ7_AMBMO|nr:unnamed protein product [Ambrosiozyma monospora]
MSNYLDSCLSRITNFKTHDDDDDDDGCLTENGNGKGKNNGHGHGHGSRDVGGNGISQDGDCSETTGLLLTLDDNGKNGDCDGKNGVDYGSISPTALTSNNNNNNNNNNNDSVNGNGNGNQQVINQGASMGTTTETGTETRINQFPSQEVTLTNKQPHNNGTLNSKQNSSSNSNSKQNSSSSSKQNLNSRTICKRISSIFLIFIVFILCNLIYLNYQLKHDDFKMLSSCLLIDVEYLSFEFVEIVAGVDDVDVVDVDKG